MADKVEEEGKAVGSGAVAEDPNATAAATAATTPTTPTTTEAAAAAAPPDGKEENGGSGENKFKKRKVALYIGFYGAAYQGMQKNSGAHTIEVSAAQLNSSPIPLSLFFFISSFSFFFVSQTSEPIFLCVSPLTGSVSGCDTQGWWYFGRERGRPEQDQLGSRG